MLRPFHSHARSRAVNPSSATLSDQNPHHENRRWADRTVHATAWTHATWVMHAALHTHHTRTRPRLVEAEAGCMYTHSQPLSPVHSTHSWMQAEPRMCTKRTGCRYVLLSTDMRSCTNPTIDIHHRRGSTYTHPYSCTSAVTHTKAAQLPHPTQEPVPFQNATTQRQ